VRGSAAGLVCARLGASAPATPDLGRACALAAATLPRGAALLVVADTHAAIGEADLRALGSRCDATFVAAADPWRGGLPLRGFARVRDAETGEQRRLFFDANASARYAAAVAEAESALRRRFERAGWRFGLLADDAEAALLGAFGLAA
jgi:hypothetical protein